MTSPSPTPERPDTEPDRPWKPEKATLKNMGEQGQLLKLFFALGATVAFGIVSCFLLGVWADRAWGLKGMGVAVGVLVGLAISFYWAYLRIGRHLSDFPAPQRHKAPDFESRPPARGGDDTDDPYYDRTDE